MPRNVKPGPAATHTSSFLSLLSGWVQQGVESFFATQRILVDLAIRQNASAIKSLREGLSDAKHSPTAILTELAAEGTANFVEAQRVLLDLAQRENEIVMTGVKERVGGYATTAAMTDLLRRSIDTFVDMQQHLLTIANKQTQTWLKTAKAGKLSDGNTLIEFAREAMDNFVHAQKRFLDVVAEETGRMTEGKPGQAKKLNKTELSKLARESAKSFVDAQKKLLDLAGHQMNVNLQAASHTMELMTPFRLIPIASLTGEGVKSFVDAEKALIDNMMKPRNGARAKAGGHAKHPPRHHKAAVAA